MDVASEANLRKVLALPWVSFGSDGASLGEATDDAGQPIHPRPFGNFARLLGHYVRDERLLTLQEAVRRLSGLPASNLRLDRRGLLRPGMFADIAVFDPRTVADRASYEFPRRYAVGMRHVLVNGQPVLRDGEHTGARPGRAIRGPGRSR